MMAKLTLPCQADPTAWDITSGSKTNGTSYGEVQRALQAVALCGQCPVMLECAAQAAANPPAHRCVQGGLIFEMTGQYTAVPVAPGKWAGRYAAAPTIAATDAPPCPECGQPLPDVHGGRKFCSQTCKNRADNRRANAKAAAAPCDICGGHRGATKHERIRHTVTCRAQIELAAA